MSVRLVERTYRDPLDEIWIGAAARIGLAVIRSPEVYASSDGKGTLALGTPETLDADDSLAQMIFHELCHSLVEGPESLEAPDWGLCNQTERDVVREHACLRLQATLAGPWGLRWFLAPTTEYRAFYDALGDDPLAPRHAPSSLVARRGAVRATQRPWGPHVEDALAATLAVVRASAPFAPAGSLASRVESPRELHPVGPFFRGAAEGTCGGCGWAYVGGPGKAVLRCRQAGGKRVESTWPGCERWEALLDCRTCGACCREAYHSVTVPARDPVIKKHPQLIVRREGRTELAREGGRCAALDGGPPAAAETDDAARYGCRIYEDRPAPCRGFELGSENCLTARRRVGLSR